MQPSNHVFFPVLTESAFPFFAEGAQLAHMHTYMHALIHTHRTHTHTHSYTHTAHTRTCTYIYTPHTHTHTLHTHAHARIYTHHTLTLRATHTHRTPHTHTPPDYKEPLKAGALTFKAALGTTVPFVPQPVCG